MRILFVDDDAMLAQGVEMALREQGHTCELAELGKQAVMMSKRNSYDIVVLDVGLPDIDGCHVARLLKMDGVDTPVLLHSGLADPSLPEEAQELGVNGFLAKPFSIGELIEHMEAVLAGRGFVGPRDTTPPPQAQPAQPSAPPSAPSQPAGDGEVEEPHRPSAVAKAREALRDQPEEPTRLEAMTKTGAGVLSKAMATARSAMASTVEAGARLLPESDDSPEGGATPKIAGAAKAVSGVVARARGALGDGPLRGEALSKARAALDTEKLSKTVGKVRGALARKPSAGPKTRAPSSKIADARQRAAPAPKPGGEKADIKSKARGLARALLRAQAAAHSQGGGDETRAPAAEEDIESAPSASEQPREAPHAAPTPGKASGPDVEPQAGEAPQSAPSAGAEPVSEAIQSIEPARPTPAPQQDAPAAQAAPDEPPGPPVDSQTEPENAAAPAPAGLSEPAPEAGARAEVDTTAPAPPPEGPRPEAGPDGPPEPPGDPQAGHDVEPAPDQRTAVHTDPEPMAAAEAEPDPPEMAPPQDVLQPEAAPDPESEPPAGPQPDGDPTPDLPMAVEAEPVPEPPPEDPQLEVATDDLSENPSSRAAGQVADTASDDPAAPLSEPESVVQEGTEAAMPAPDAPPSTPPRSAGSGDTQHAPGGPEAAGDTDAEVEDVLDTLFGPVGEVDAAEGESAQQTAQRSVEAAVIMDGETRHAGVVVERTENGAVLRLRHPEHDLSEILTLQILDGPELRCALSWREEDRIGVEFF